MARKYYHKVELEAISIVDLRKVAKEEFFIRPKNTKKAELIDQILERQKQLVDDKKAAIADKNESENPIARPERKRVDYPEVKFSPNNRGPRQGTLRFDSGYSKPEKDNAGANEVKTAVEVKQPVIEVRQGVVDTYQDFAFMRTENYEVGPRERDAHINKNIIKQYGLRKGDWIKAECNVAPGNNAPPVVKVLEINGIAPEKVGKRPHFEQLTPIYPEERYKLESAGSKSDFAIRAIDLVAPIGKGQRAMIVSPPKAGKTTLLKKIAGCIHKNYPTAYIMVLLIDERPEEVTDMKRFMPTGEVVYSTFDKPPEHHTKAAELVLERAKRIVELGGDVVIIMDSLTRLARAYNLTITPTGRTLSGGIDPAALHDPKRFFGAARNIENGGSLTIIATALVDTGSRMDDVIYEEFKGTGNMEIHLDRKLSEKRIFPAIDLARSGTRREELLLSQKELEGIWAIRRLLSTGDTAEAAENLMGLMMKTADNAEFINQVTLQLKAFQKEGFIK